MCEQPLCLTYADRQTCLCVCCVMLWCCDPVAYKSAMICAHNHSFRLPPLHCLWCLPPLLPLGVPPMLLSHLLLLLLLLVQELFGGQESSSSQDAAAVGPPVVPWRVLQEACRQQQQQHQQQRCGQWAALCKTEQRHYHTQHCRAIPIPPPQHPFLHAHSNPFVFAPPAASSTCRIKYNTPPCAPQ